MAIRKVLLNFAGTCLSRNRLECVETTSAVIKRSDRRNFFVVTQFLFIFILSTTFSAASAEGSRMHIAPTDCCPLANRIS